MPANGDMQEFVSSLFGKSIVYDSPDFTQTCTISGVTSDLVTGVVTAIELTPSGHPGLTKPIDVSMEWTSDGEYSPVTDKSFTSVKLVRMQITCMWLQFKNAKLQEGLKYARDVLDGTASCPPPPKRRKTDVKPL